MSLSDKIKEFDKLSSQLKTASQFADATPWDIQKIIKDLKTLAQLKDTNPEQAMEQWKKIVAPAGEAYYKLNQLHNKKEAELESIKASQSAMREVYEKFQK